MKTNVDYGLEGAFKVDLYSGGQLMESTDWFSNFITQTGLLYPTIYPFAQCFMFLSLGYGSQANDGGYTSPGNYSSINSTVTTGLQYPYDGSTTTATIGTSQGAQTGTWIGWSGYQISQNNSSACKTIINANGISFFKAWSIPTGGPTVTVNQPGGFLPISELMVSPSFGNDPTGCFAFSRILRNISIPNGYKTVISYQLSLNLLNATGYSYFNSGTFLTGNADIDTDLDIVGGWANLSGIYRQVMPGLVYLDTNGALVQGQAGYGMEPSLQDLSKYTFYFSPDNSMFDVNNLNGGAQTNVNLAYNSDGLLQYNAGNISLTYTPSPQPVFNDAFYYYTFPIAGATTNYNVTPVNIRLGMDGAGINDPCIINYATSFATYNPNNYNYQSNINVNSTDIVTGLPLSYATPGATGFNPHRDTPPNELAVFSSIINVLPFSSAGENGPAGRKKTVTRKALFPPGSSMGYNNRFGSMVFAYFDTTQTPTAGQINYWPMVDTLFFDSSGRTTMQHYRQINNIWLTQRGSGVADAYAVIIPSGLGNTARIGGLQTFQGPYVNNGFGYDTNAPALTVGGGMILDGSTEPIGLIASGNFPVGIPGLSTFDSKIDGWPIAPGSGLGMVYGLCTTNNFWDESFDVGLADHSLSNLTAPSITGQLWWPYYAYGNQMQLIFTGVKFYDSGIGLVNDSGNYFVNNKQIVSGLTFQDVDSSRLTTVLGIFFSGNPALFNLSPTLALDSTVSGYYLTTGRWNYHTLISNDTGMFINVYSGYLNYGVTGFLDPSAPTNYGAPSSSTVLSKCLAIPIYSGINTAPLAGGAGGFNVTSAVRITGFFQTPYDRGYNNLTWNNGNSYNGTTYPFFVSGHCNGYPLYLTYVWNSGSALVAHSFLQTTITPSNFVQPSGFLTHYESIGNNPPTGNQLLPNYGQASSTGAFAYPPVVGGSYPALSYDNGVELYFNINWSAPCPSNTNNCNPPV